MSHILLHVCCAPCATHPLEILKSEGEVTGFFANPNIQPQSEYEKRLDEARRFFKETGVPLLEDSYDPEEWNDAVAGLENEPEGGRRCGVCFEVRLRAAAMMAKRLGCDSFTTTLTVSRHKNSNLINRIGSEIATQAGVKFRADNFKKRGGYDRSIELSRKWGLYRQDYCGCLYSLEEKRKKRLKVQL